MNSNHEYTNERITIPIMSGLVIDLAEEGLARAERILTGIPGGAKKAIGSALARAAASGKTYAKTAVAEEYNISGSTFLRYTKNMNHFTTDKNAIYQSYSVLRVVQYHSLPLRKIPTEMVTCTFVYGAPEQVQCSNTLSLPLWAHTLVYMSVSQHHVFLSENCMVRQRPR